MGYVDKQLFINDQNELGINIKEILLDKIQWINELNNQAELRQVCEELLNYVSKGDILFYNYPYIFSKYERLIEDSIYQKDLESLFNKFNKGLDISFNTFNGIVNEENLSIIQVTDSVFLKKLKEKVNLFHAELNHKKEKVLADKFLQEFDFGGGQFENYFTFYIGKSLFQYFPPSYLSTRLFNSNPKNISSFCSFLYQKYEGDNYKTIVDIEYLEILMNEIQSGMKNVDDNLKKYFLQGVIEQAGKSVNGLKEKNLVID
jgi:regulator of sigma D